MKDYDEETKYGVLTAFSMLAMWLIGITLGVKIGIEIF